MPGAKTRKTRRVIEMDLSLWRAGMQKVLRGDPKSLIITRTLTSVLRYIGRQRWQGACHAVSAVIYVLFREQGVEAELCLGEVQRDRVIFNHSWIEIDGAVCDAAIVLTLNGEQFSAPIVKGIDVQTGKASDVKYGVDSGQPDDSPTAMLRKTSFVDFLDGFPGHPHGLWGLAADLGTPLGLQLDIPELREQYADTRWRSR